MKVWQRPEQPVAQQRKSKPIEEKESYRWLEGYQSACEVKQACPATLVVNMADREGDIQEWFVDAMRREPEQRCHRAFSWPLRHPGRETQFPGRDAEFNGQKQGRPVCCCLIRTGRRWCSHRWTPSCVVQHMGFVAV
ncbi:MAG TPA: hypothetical protein VLK82_19750 [Candidatus Tectomicrobia bacterium]|nr:hypothetical protein [Candidatus Tectomicrobia bacterium]